jgi:putative DNA primase/helicase
MRQKDILKEILDNLPKVDFKEIYAKELYQRLAKETDSEKPASVQTLFHSDYR